MSETRTYIRYASVRTKKRRVIKVKDGYRDIYGRIWDIPRNELCRDCGQPDSCGDCNHNRLTNKEVKILGVIRTV